MCAYLKVNSESLFHVDSKERLINIIQQHEKQTDGPDMTVKHLHKGLQCIRAKRAASLLLKKAINVCEQHKENMPPSDSSSGSEAEPGM